jgi:hypothetical protein
MSSSEAAGAGERREDTKTELVLKCAKSGQASRAWTSYLELAKTDEARVTAAGMVVCGELVMGLCKAGEMQKAGTVYHAVEKSSLRLDPEACSAIQLPAS